MGHRLLPRLVLAGAPLLALVAAELLARKAGGTHAPESYFRILEHDGRPVTDAAGKRLLACDPVMAQLAGRPDVGRRFFSAQRQPGSLRIFCLGASTTYGMGVAPQASFSRYLEARLRRLLDRDDVAVVNVGKTALDSHDYPPLAAELVRFDADLWVVYAGHNELKYPNLGRVQAPTGSWLLSWARRSALLRLFLTSRDAEVPLPVVEKPFLTEAQRARARELFRSGLEAVLREARAVGIPVLFCVPASNVLDKGPRQTLLAGGEAGAEMRAQLREAEQAMGDLVGQNLWRERLEAMTVAHPEAALPFYLLGRVWLEAENVGRARAAFARSLELDALPERAPPDFQQVVREVAREAAAVAIEIPARFEHEARRGVAGDDLFVDYCHPNLWGHWLIADEILRSLRDSEVLVPASAYDAAREPGADRFAAYNAELGLSNTQSAEQRVQTVLGFLGQALSLPTAAPERARLLAVAAEALAAAERLDPELSSLHVARATLAAVQGRSGAARRAIERALAIDAQKTAAYAVLAAQQPAFRRLFNACGIAIEDGQFALKKEDP